MNILEIVICDLLLLKSRISKIEESENQKMDARIPRCHSGDHRTPYPQQPPWHPSHRRKGVPIMATAASEDSQKFAVVIPEIPSPKK